MQCPNCGHDVPLQFTTYEVIRCPVTGIPSTQDCRCQLCRPDLHVAAGNYLPAQTYMVNTTAAAAVPAATAIRWP